MARAWITTACIVSGQTGTVGRQSISCSQSRTWLGSTCRCSAGDLGRWIWRRASTGRKELFSWAWIGQVFAAACRSRRERSEVVCDGDHVLSLTRHSVVLTTQYHVCVAWQVPSRLKRIDPGPCSAGSRIGGEHEKQRLFKCAWTVDSIKVRTGTIYYVLSDVTTQLAANCVGGIRILWCNTCSNTATSFRPWIFFFIVARPLVLIFDWIVEIDL